MIKTMKLKINGDEIELIYSFRSAIYFEQIAKHGLNFENMSSDDFITLFYCVVVASLQKSKKPVITMLDFLDTVDENGGEKCLMAFSEWYINTIKAQYEVLDDGKEVKEEKTSKKNQKKKN